MSDVVGSTPRWLSGGRPLPGARAARNLKPWSPLAACSFASRADSGLSARQPLTYEGLFQLADKDTQARNQMSDTTSSQAAGPASAADVLPFSYNARLASQIESRWQERWAADGTYHSPNPSGPLSGGFEAFRGRPTAYVLDMFAYPSGAGLHVGHPLGYIAADAHARYLRMTGHHVLHAMGHDAFGLPAEQYAIETGQHPEVTTAANIELIRGQLRRLGLGHDPRREIITCDPAFYRWTQWIFLKIFDSWFDERAGRARPISELIASFESGELRPAAGRPWPAMTSAERRQAVDSRRLAYLSDELVNWCPGLGTVLANEEITAAGRSDVGNYPVCQRPLRQWMLRITAYADTLLAGLDDLDWPESVKRIQRNWIGASDGDDGRRTYRLRDWLFSRQRYWGEPFPVVHDEHGPIALPERMLPVLLPAMTDFRPARAAAGGQADPVPPLARAPGWARVDLDLGEGKKTYRRDLNVMPQWAGSCWYYLRYLDPGNDRALADPRIERYWMAGQPAGRAKPGGGGVDLYLGGPEHATTHLLYARFWHQVLYDLGYVSTREPFAALVLHGNVLADAFTDARGRYVPAAQVTPVPGGGYARHGEPVTRRAGKMGKSLKNGVSPDDICDSYGADTLRLHEMAMGPVDADRRWETADIAGAHRFLRRLWRSMIDERTGEPAVDDQPLDEATARELDTAIAAIRRDYGALRFNTAIARLRQLSSRAARISAAGGPLPRALAEPLALMTAPLAPHIAEELWSRLGHPGSITGEPFPQPGEQAAGRQMVALPVLVDGRKRREIEVPADAGEAAIAEILAPHLADLQVRRLVIVPGRIVNVVTQPHT
jgi:leucyl-tRNA synthetase